MCPVSAHRLSPLELDGIPTSGIGKYCTKPGVDSSSHWTDCHFPTQVLSSVTSAVCIGWIH